MDTRAMIYSTSVSRIAVSRRTAGCSGSPCFAATLLCRAIPVTPHTASMAHYLVAQRNSECALFLNPPWR